MFTGIVSDIGTLRSLRRGDDGAVLEFTCRLAGEDLQRGESVSVSGVCLTVESAAGGVFRATASPETLRHTSLGGLQPGGRVNLERALRPTDRMGGHLVQGHVDATGRVRAVRSEGVSRVLSLAAPEAVRRHLVDRGSVAVDGVSLTVTAVDRAGFEVTLIPATLEQTTLSELRPGDGVNLEADIVSKYVAQQVRAMAAPAAGAPGEWLAGDRD